MKASGRIAGKPWIAACAAADTGMAALARSRCRSHVYSTPRNNVSSASYAETYQRFSCVT